MELFIMIGLVLFIVAAIILLKVMKHVFTAVISVIGLFLVLTAAVGFIAYNDVMEIKDTAPNTPNLFLLNDRTDIIAGVAFDPDTKPIEEGIKPLDQEQLDFVISNRKNLEREKTIEELKDEVDEIDEELFKIITFDINVIEEAPLEELNLQFINIEKETIIDLLRSEDIYGDISELMVEEDSVMEEMQEEMPFDINVSDIAKEELEKQARDALEEFASTEEELKGMLFMLSIGAIVEENTMDGVRFMFENYKEDDITIYPETITFSILKLSPQSLVNQIIQEVNAGQE